MRGCQAAAKERYSGLPGECGTRVLEREARQNRPPRAGIALAKRPDFAFSTQYFKEKGVRFDETDASHGTRDSDRIACSERDPINTMGSAGSGRKGGR